jgi:hypothetical protein
VQFGRLRPPIGHGNLHQDVLGAGEAGKNARECKCTYPSGGLSFHCTKKVNDCDCKRRNNSLRLETLPVGMVIRKFSENSKVIVADLSHKVSMGFPLPSPSATGAEIGFY